MASPEAESELAVGFFGSRYERATPAEREYMRAMAAIGDEPVPTSNVADELGRKPSSLSPARDGLIKKGLIYSFGARPHRLHRAALRQVPPLAAGVAPPVSSTSGRSHGADRSKRGPFKGISILFFGIAFILYTDREL